MREGEAEYKGRTYNEWVNAYNKQLVDYESYCIARKILVEGIKEEKAVKEVEDVTSQKSSNKRGR